MYIDTYLIVICYCTKKALIEIFKQLILLHFMGLESITKKF